MSSIIFPTNVSAMTANMYTWCITKDGYKGATLTAKRYNKAERSLYFAEMHTDFTSQLGLMDCINKKGCIELSQSAVSNNLTLTPIGKMFDSTDYKFSINLMDEDGFSMGNVLPSDILTDDPVDRTGSHTLHFDIYNNAKQDYAFVVIKVDNKVCDSILTDGFSIMSEKFDVDKIWVRLALGLRITKHNDELVIGNKLQPKNKVHDSITFNNEMRRWSSIEQYDALKLWFILNKVYNGVCPLPKIDSDGLDKVAEFPIKVLGIIETNLLMNDTYVNEIYRYGLIDSKLQIGKYDRYFSKSDPKLTIGYRTLGGAEYDVDRYASKPVYELSTYSKIKFKHRDRIGMIYDVPDIELYYVQDKHTHLVLDSFIVHNGDINKILRCIPTITQGRKFSAILGDIQLEECTDNIAFDTFIQGVILLVKKYFEFDMFLYATYAEIKNTFTAMMFTSNANTIEHFATMLSPGRYNTIYGNCIEMSTHQLLLRIGYDGEIIHKDKYVGLLAMNVDLGNVAFGGVSYRDATGTPAFHVTVMFKDDDTKAYIALSPALKPDAIPILVRFDVAQCGDIAINNVILNQDALLSKHDFTALLCNNLFLIHPHLLKLIMSQLRKVWFSDRDIIEGAKPQLLGPTGNVTAHTHIPPGVYHTLVRPPYGITPKIGSK